MREHHFFTSDLSVNEFLLVKEVGFQPLGLVMGSSIYHIGFGQVAWNQNCEITHMTQALYHSRELAMTRMEEEADELGADGIVGVRLDVNLHAWGQNVIEFLAIGTAIKARRGAAGLACAEQQAVPERSLGAGLLDAAPRRLSPARFRDGQLRLSHRRPGHAVGPAAEHGAARATRRPSTTRASSPWSACRPRPPSSVRRASSASQVEETNHTWGYNVIEFSAVGTAVIAISKDHKIPVPSLVLSVND